MRWFEKQDRNGGPRIANTPKAFVCKLHQLYKSKQTVSG